jgi:hypothetical protein
MTVIHRASPWDDLSTLRRAGTSVAITDSQLTDSQLTDSQPSPDLVGTGDRR